MQRRSGVLAPGPVRTGISCIATSMACPCRWQTLPLCRVLWAWMFVPGTPGLSRACPRPARREVAFVTALGADKQGDELLALCKGGLGESWSVAGSRVVSGL